MTASFPGSVKTFATLVDLADSVLAAHQNSQQDEIVAMQNHLIDAASEVTVSSGVLTVTKSRHKVQPESGTADDIDTISGMADNSLLVLFASDNGTDALTLKHGTGNISCFGGADIELSEGIAVCFYDGTTVFVVGGEGGETQLSAASPRVYTANDTWTKPAGLVYVVVEVFGGGGGGGGADTTGAGQASVGAGGGEGGYSKEKILEASLSATETVTVGAGGAGSAGGNGATGGTTSFGAHCQSTGGSGGIKTSATSTNNSAPGGAGGIGSGGDINRGGNPGQLALSTGGIGVGGAGGGAGGAGTSTGTGVDGNAGSAYGGGGSGGLNRASQGTARAGGAGADGVVIVWEYVNE